MEPRLRRLSCILALGALALVVNASAILLGVFAPL